MMMASGRNGPPATTPSGNTYSASLFIIAVCGLAAASGLCRATDARLLKYVAMPARIIIGTPTPITAYAVEFGERLQAVLLDHRRAHRCAEQVRVQEVPDVGRAEHVVAQRPVLLHRQPQPADTGLGPVERHQHVIQPEEDRQLRQHRQTAQDRVEPVLLLQLLHLQRHPLAVLAVLLLQRLDLRLQLLHLPRGADLPDERLVQDRAQGEHQEHHRQRPGEEVRRPQHEGERLVPNPHDRRHRVVNDVQAEPTKHASRSLLAMPGYPTHRRRRPDPSSSPASAHDSRPSPRRSGIGSHPPLCHGPHFSSRTTASHPPFKAPYSVSASTAYWLHVGVNRHVGSRSGETVWRYSWMTKITPRAAADRPASSSRPTLRMRARATPCAVLVRAAPRSRSGCQATPGSPPGPRGPGPR